VISATNTPVIAFTLCSNNYLPMARVWMDSLLKHEPDATVVIGLVDRKDPSVDYSQFAPAEIIPVADLGIPDFEGMVLRYRIIELNTAIKPFLFLHLFKRVTPVPGQVVLYFDPDIKIFSPLKPLLDELSDQNILLTPHIFNPVPEDHAPFGEQIFLNYGIYNLGFCGMRWSAETERALEWWSKHLIHRCKNDVKHGLFVDQLWMNLAPLFFQGVRVSRHLGFNVAYWNLHERTLEAKDGAWTINHEWPLVFFHFSSFEYHKPDSLGYHSIYYHLKNRPEMRSLFDEYRAELTRYNYPVIRQLPCAYVLDRRQHFDQQTQDYYKKHPFRWCLSKFKRVTPRKLVLSLKDTSPDEFMQ
jgi:hypothetical protein